MSSPDLYEHDAHHQGDVQVNRERPVVKEQSTYMTDRDAEKMCQLFADGLDAGIGYARILDFMERQKLDTKLVRRMRHAVLELGDRLGEAFARFGVLDAPSRKLVLVAEEQGALPETFREQARTFGRRYHRKKQIVFGMVEPAILLCLGAFYFRNIVTTAMDLQQVLGPNTWDIVADAMVLGTLESAVFLGLMGFVAYAWLNVPVDSNLRDAIGRLWYRSPFISSPQRLASIASFCRYLRTSIRSGIDMFRSIDLAAEASNSPFFMETARRVQAALEAGYPLDQALRTMKGIPDEVLDYVGIGEETGKLDEQLLFLSQRYEKEADEAYERQLNSFVYLLRMVFIVLIFVFAVFKAVIGGFVPF